MNGISLLVLLPLFVGLVHSFSWEIVVGEGTRLKFYNNGTLTHTVDNPSSKELLSVTYDPVDFRVLFSDRDYYDTNMTISCYDLTTGKVQPITVTRLPHNYTSSYASLAYDPIKQLLFWSENMNIYSMPLKPASSNTTVDRNLILTLNKQCIDLAVDSCGGYIYFATNSEIERAAFDGSERKVLVNNGYARRSVVIDQQTQRMFWIQATTGNYYSIESADWNGKNRRIVYTIGKEFFASALTVSKDYIYWGSTNHKAILRLPKHQQDHVAPTFYAGFSTSIWANPLTATNYTIEEQTSGMKSCEALKSLTHRSTAESSLETELQIDGSPCHNYCLEGNCSISSEGLPICSCGAGYSGMRCEVNVCYKHCLHGGVCSLNEEDEPICQCPADYEGERCGVPTSTSSVQAEDTKQEIRQDLRREIKQVITEELRRALLFFSNKIDEYEAKIE